MTAKESIQQGFELAFALVDVLPTAAREAVKCIVTSHTDRCRLEEMRLKEVQIELEEAKSRGKALLEKEQETIEVFAEIQSALTAANEGRDDSENTPPRDQLLFRLSELEDTVAYLSSRVSLYSIATQVRWDYKEADSFSGCILRNGSRTRFELPSELDSFEEVNLLWRILASDDVNST